MPINEKTEKEKEKESKTKEKVEKLTKFGPVPLNMTGIEKLLRERGWQGYFD
jgi:hypothetical protein